MLKFNRFCKVLGGFGGLGLVADGADAKDGLLCAGKLCSLAYQLDGVGLDDWNGLDGCDDECLWCLSAVMAIAHSPSHDG